MGRVGSAGHGLTDLPRPHGPAHHVCRQDTLSRNGTPTRTPEGGEEEAVSAASRPVGPRTPPGGRRRTRHSRPVTPGGEEVSPGERGPWGPGFRCSVSSRGHEAQRVGGWLSQQAVGTLRTADAHVHGRTDGRHND